jgi:hypothetical protein
MPMSRLRLSYQTNKQRGQTLFGRYLLRRAADVHVPFGNAGVGPKTRTPAMSGGAPEIL